MKYERSREPFLQKKTKKRTLVNILNEKIKKMQFSSRLTLRPFHIKRSREPLTQKKKKKKKIKKKTKKKKKKSFGFTLRTFRLERSRETVPKKKQKKNISKRS